MHGRDRTAHRRSSTVWMARFRLSVLTMILAFAYGQTLYAQQGGSGPPAATPGAKPAGGDDLSTQANDPTAPVLEMQFQNSYTPVYYGAEGEGNIFILQPVLPGKPHGWLPPTITRPTIPVVSTANGRTGLGDILIVAVGIYNLKPKWKLGVGPTFVAPSATNRFAGSGKWQLGPSAVTIYTGIRGMVLGTLVENPISFAGESSRADTNAMSLQPIIVKTLAKSYYVRFDPTMNFDWERGGAGTVPVNLGLGKIFKVRTQAVSAYLEPEWTVHRPAYLGAASPKFTLRLSVTLLYPEKK